MKHKARPTLGRKPFGHTEQDTSEKKKNLQDGCVRVRVGLDQVEECSMTLERTSRRKVSRDARIEVADRGRLVFKKLCKCFDSPHTKDKKRESTLRRGPRTESAMPARCAERSELASVSDDMGIPDSRAP